METDCDVVDICLPNFLHHDAAVTALSQGRDVICEKPLATTVEDAYDIINTAEKYGRRVYYAEDWLGSPRTAQSKRNNRQRRHRGFDFRTRASATAAHTARLRKKSNIAEAAAWCI